MKAALLLGILVGFAGVLAGAHLYPWVDHPRLPSRTSVVANGGRAETFLIHLPADRIQSAGAAAVGLRATAYPAGAELPPELGDAAFLAEHFKIRDADGQVIGIAARHWTEADGGPAAAWTLLIPSRGALFLAASGEAARRVDTALERAGQRAGQQWSGQLDVELAGAEVPGRIVGGSEEFARLGGTYRETWKITGVSPSGELRGTIALDTITARSAPL